MLFCCTESAHDRLMADDSDYRPGPPPSEYLPSEDPPLEALPSEDLLELGRRRSAPRWVVLGLWVGLAAIVVTGLIIGGATSGPSPKPGPTSAGPVFSQPIGGPVGDDLAIEGGALFRLSHGALFRMGIGAGGALTPTGLVPIEGLNLTLPTATFHLVVDSGAQHIWVVTYGASPATLVEVDARTMRVLGQLVWPSEVHAAAALDGHLYLAAVNAVVDVVSATAEPTTVAALSGQYSDVVADPTRSRLVLAGDDHGDYLQTYEPASGQASGTVPQSFAKIGLQVVDGAIWAGGFGPHGAVLARLDASTLRPVAFSSLSPQLAAGDLLVAAGTDVLWVRRGGDADGLWCLSAATGDQLEYWQDQGAVASTHGAAFVAQRDGPLPLELTACPG